MIRFSHQNWAMFTIWLTAFFVVAELPAQPVVINEFLASNKSGLLDKDGEASDWLELFNSGPSAADLDGLTLSDNPEEPGQWALPSVTLAPGEFLLVWASGKDLGGGEFHTNFKLGKGGETLGLYRPDGSVLDEITFGAQNDDVSLARIPDGSGSFSFATSPTPGSTNSPAPEKTPAIVINELLASNVSTNTDSEGDFEDWIELYNAGETAVDLGGFTITDNAGNPDQWVLPSVTLQPDSFLVLWASGKDTVDAEWHTNFKLGKGGEFVGLHTPTDAVVDSLTFGAQADDISLARSVDGAGVLARTTTGTPGSPNVITLPPEEIPDIKINEFLASNVLSNTDVFGFPEDWIELYNADEKAVELAGFTLTDDVTNPGQWVLPDLTLEPGGFLVLWASGRDTVRDGEIHMNFKLGAGGETIGLYMPSGPAVDQTTFATQSADISMARIPDGTGLFTFTGTPTPGSANTFTDPPEVIPTIVINEVLASNIESNFDEDGDASDWIELYNADSDTVDLRGFGLNDNVTASGQWALPSLRLPPGEFMLIWASGKNRNKGELHTDFNLGRDGEIVSFWTPLGTLVDQVSFQKQLADVSMARSPDGTGSFFSTATPTPDTTNRIIEPTEGLPALFINEFLASNDQSHLDEDGEASDWIEIYNGGSAAVDLGGYSLTDTETEPTLWVFPAVTLDPGAFLVIWASGKNRDVGELHANFKLGKDGDYLGLYSRLGSLLDEVTFGPQTDDVSMARDPDGSGSFEFTSTPTAGASNLITEPGIPNIVINEILASNDASSFDEDGQASDWLELYNAGSKTADLGGFMLTDNASDPGQWSLPAVSLKSGDYLLIWASGKNRTGPQLHTNFSLGAAGEYIGLYTRSGELVDEFEFGAQRPDISMARIPDGGGDFEPTSDPTAGGSNRSGVLPEKALIFSPASGFFSGSVTVKLTTELSGAVIRYTLDGSQVTSQSRKYSEPLEIGSTKALRARVYQGSSPASKDISQIYVIDYKGHLPVLSIATADKNLFGRTGIFDNPKKRGDSWERPVSVNLLELDGSGFQINAGARTHGQHARTLPKLSVRLHFRSEYGAGKLKYKLFEQRDLDSFNRLVVHSGGSFDQPTGSDKWTFVRDPLNHTLAMEMGANASAFRPVILYINGKLWGIYQIRERINADYLRDHLGIEDADLLEWNHNPTPKIKEGDLIRWHETETFFENNSLRSDAKFQRATEFVDLDNFMDYNILQIFAGHTDWPHNNVFFFRERTSGAKWRWILWDSESTHRKAKVKALEWATRAAPRDDISSDNEQQLFGTLLLRRFVENDTFKERFINRFADLLNTTLRSDHVRPILDRLAAEIEPNIQLEAERWDGTSSEWRKGIAQVRTYIADRPRMQRNHIQSFFGLKGRAIITLKVDNPSGGQIRINTIVPEDLPWTGTYFKGVPVTLEAIPYAGFRFDGWSGGSLPNKQIVELDLSSDLAITARFKSAGAFVQVQSPNGGEQLAVGQKFDITWISDQAGTNVDIDLSIDNGEGWTSIVRSTPNDGKYSWSVPNIASTSALVRVTGVSSSSPTDLSDAAFELKDSGGLPALPAITEFHPASGLPGTLVTITGANLTGASSVRFGASEASSFSIQSPSSIHAEVPSNAGSGKITVTTPVGNAESSTNFTALTGGSATETLSFEPTDDTFVWSKKPGDNYGNSGNFRVRSTSKIQRTFLKFKLSGIPGKVKSAKLRLHVLDESDDGGSVRLASNNYKTGEPWQEAGLVWNNAPSPDAATLSSIGKAGAGSTVECDVSEAVSGDGIVSFAVGNKSFNMVEYSSKEGLHPPVLVVEFESTVEPPPLPEISSFTPTSAAVGTVVTITGKNLSVATSVSFGGQESKDFSIKSESTIHAQVPAQAKSGKIKVTTSDGTAESVNDFTVSNPVSAPEITSFHPSSGVVGTVVTITGRSFSEATSVSFGGKESNDFSEESGTTIHVQVPEGAKSGKIKVITPDGSSESNADFTVEVPPALAPTIARFSPAKGQVGSKVLIVGNNLGGVASVNFGDVPASEFTVESDTSVVATVPQGASDGKLTVTTAGGEATSAAAFEVIATEVVSGTLRIEPSDDAYVSSKRPGRNYGNDGDLRVKGPRLTIQISYLKFNVSGLAGLVTSAKLQLHVTDGSDDGGGVYSISNTFKGSNTLWHEDGLAWENAPPIEGAALSTLKKINEKSTVEFDVTAGVLGDGMVSFAVRNSSANFGGYSSKEGNQAPVLVVDFAGSAGPVPAPQITSFSPAHGEPGTEVTINGENLSGATSVTFAGVASEDLSVESAAIIKVKVPDEAKTGKVTVTTAGGTAESEAVFTVEEPMPAPIITDFSPREGQVGTEVRIEGEHFTDASSVKFGDLISEFSVESDGVIVAVVPKAASTDKITVSNESGSSQSADEFTIETDPVEGGTFTFESTDDSFVWSKRQGNNYGAWPELRVRSTRSAQQFGYLKFRVSGVVGVIQEARLRLQVTDASNDGGGVYLVSNDWQQSSLVWSNAPKMEGKALSSIGAVSSGDIVEFDVKEAISGDGTYSFGLMNNSDDAVKYSSKEGPFVPELIIVTGEGLAKTTGTAGDEEFGAEDAALAKRDLVPESLQLRQNYPNPFNLETTIEYGLPSPALVKVIIFNLRGQEVRRLVDQVQSAGIKTVRWEGRDTLGQEVASGVYLLFLRAGSRQLSYKMLLQK